MPDLLLDAGESRSLPHLLASSAPLHRSPLAATTSPSTSDAKHNRLRLSVLPLDQIRQTHHVPVTCDHPLS